MFRAALENKGRIEAAMEEQDDEDNKEDTERFNKFGLGNANQQKVLKALNDAKTPSEMMRVILEIDPSDFRTYDQSKQGDLHGRLFTAVKQLVEAQINSAGRGKPVAESEFVRMLKHLVDIGYQFIHPDSELIALWAVSTNRTETKIVKTILSGDSVSNIAPVIVSVANVIRSGKLDAENFENANEVIGSSISAGNQRLLDRVFDNLIKEVMR